MNRKWLQIMALAVSFPSSILVVSWIAFQLKDSEILTQGQAIFVILGYICAMLILMVYYAYRRKG